MENKKYSQSGIPIRKTKDFLPTIFQTDANDKFLSGTLDTLTQSGTLEKVVGYVGKKSGKTFNGKDVYIDNDNTLRSRYQLEPGVLYKENNEVKNFYDYLDFKNILKFFGNTIERDDLINKQEHYTWDPPIDWDKFINYRDYYWVPSGPSTVRVLGQAQNITSTYRINLGAANTFVFSPDGFTNNPTITLYRGQTYRFVVNSPKNGFSIKVSYDTGSLQYNPDKSYVTGQLAVFDGKLWRALRDISLADGSTINENSQDWEYVSPEVASSSLDWNSGVSNNGIESGTITFKVPFNAPDILFYQSTTNPDRFGRFIIADIEENTKINIEKEIIGKTNYSSSNGIDLSNGMLINFGGSVQPEKYATGNWLVEGVGKFITLTLFDSLIVPTLTSDIPEVLFDNTGFDSAPFDDASSYPGTKDYITISKSSKDLNPWSRYNRWFHKSVLEYSSRISGSAFSSNEAARAKRPIIEFLPDMHLYNHGTIAKQTVDVVDTVTTDVFSIIEGSKGYIIDNEQLFEGARILILADTDKTANNYIYEVNFIIHNGSRQIHLSLAEDGIPQAGETVLVRRGQENKEKMFYFDGERWNESQSKTTINQPPVFDAYDENDVSLANSETYPVSTFEGTKIFSYKVGNGAIDKELRFSLSYLNIDNVGDILFDFDWDRQTFSFEDQGIEISKNISVGYYKINGERKNSWSKFNDNFNRYILDFYVFQDDSNEAIFDTIDWKNDSYESIYFYENGDRISIEFENLGNKFTFSKIFKKGTALTLKLFSTANPVSGYYEFPLGLEKNPFNDNLNSFTYGQAKNHLSSGLEFYQEYTIDDTTLENNLRDLNGYQLFSNRFLKHAYPAPISLALLCDKTNNIVKSLQQAKKSYSDYKLHLITLAEQKYYDQTSKDLLDELITEISKSKNSSSAYFKSDMIGSGAFSKIEYIVEDVGITTFALSSRFSLTEYSDKAVYVYINDSQLLYGRDYSFNEQFGFVEIIKSLNEGDRLEIREYVSTTSNYIPPTPTKLGLYKKYTPKKFLDDTYVVPKQMIQGHDGSLITAYGDFRDDLILEFENRIYNNIKTQYDEDLFDIDEILGGYYGNSIYSKEHYFNIISKEFLKWISDTNIDYITNEFFDTENSFTYTYSNMTDPTGREKLPGYWRGVYRWFYDTDRPHSHPWEMLGFTEKPEWWNDEYGPAPYTRGNLILWEDLENGLIKQGLRAGRYARYARPNLTKHIPVDNDGNLLSPLDSNLSRDFSLILNQGDFKLGDISPVENAWYISSEYPFAVCIALCLLRPFDFIGYGIVKPSMEINPLGQKVRKDKNTYVKMTDFIDSASVSLLYYVREYLKTKNISEQSLINFINGLDVNLTYRMSGFVDQQQQKFLLDSKSPKSSASSVFVPQENQQIYFNVSTPISKITYSAVILEKVNNGWKIRGYDAEDPYFYYKQAIPFQNDPIITIGGVSENFLSWETDKFYGNGVIVLYNNEFYRSLNSHQSSDTFDNSKWKKLPSLPTVGAVTGFLRRNFSNKTSVLNYGTVLLTTQSVIDFILGYGAYLESLGFVFDNYDAVQKVSQDWTTSCKEFLYWTQHNWAVESLISLSPASQKLDLRFKIGVPDNLLDSFYEYQIYRSDGNPLGTEFLSIKREYQNFVISTVDTTDGIYFCKIFPVLKEHVAVFSDRTVFNDVIYDKTSGYRQERIKVRGFRTVDWDGDYTSPGFIFDNVNISNWNPFVDYRLGDIVNYKNILYSSKLNQQGQESFDNSLWNELDLIPQKQLIPNFDYKINQFEDYFNLDADGVQQSQRELGRHLIGYQKRDYLQDLAEDEVTQFQLYQGYIREKGTKNSINKIFDKISSKDRESITLHEEWAFRTAIYGGSNQYNDFEFLIDKNNLPLEPQPIIFTVTKTDLGDLQRYVEIPESEFIKYPIPFNPNFFSKRSYDNLQTAGYVRLDQVDYNLANKDEILDININQVRENQHFYISFLDNEWGVYRFVSEPLLYIIDAVKNKQEVKITLNRTHDFKVDDIIGVKQIPNLIGFFKIKSIGLFEITVEVDADAQDPLIDYSSINRIYRFVESRARSNIEFDPEQISLLPEGAKIWADDDGTGKWQVVQKKKVYNFKNIIDYGTPLPQHTGRSVLYNSKLRQTIASMPDESLVLVMIEGSEGLHIKEILTPDQSVISKTRNSFGESLAISPDNKYLIVGAPLASELQSFFVGNYDPFRIYREADIVFYGGNLWRAIINDPNNINDGFDGSTINIANQNWVIVDNIPYAPPGRGNGYNRQGAIFIYTYTGQVWNLSRTLLSPRPDTDEKFGSKVSIGLDGNTYWLTVSAPGAVRGRGRVYIFKNEGTDWVHHQNPNFRGIYNPDPDQSTYYPEGSIVWYEGSLWRALEDSTVSDGSTINEFSSSWLKVDPVSTDCSLPSNLSIDDDGSTLLSGLLSSDDLAELTKEGDNFGYSISMNHDASVLVVGSPNSDGQYFPKYRGIWRESQTYVEGDVVKFADRTAPSQDPSYSYYQLSDTRDIGLADSTIESFGERPDAGLPWVSVGDSSSFPSGKVFVYRRDQFDVFKLHQTFNSGSIADFNDTGDSSITVNFGDEFGHAVDIDTLGNNIIVSAPLADVDFQNQGAVYYFSTANLTSPQWRLKQKIRANEVYNNTLFGSAISLTSNADRIVVGAKNTPYRAIAFFNTYDRYLSSVDESTLIAGGTYPTYRPANIDELANNSTTFDGGSTVFSEFIGYTGQVYVFERIGGKYYLAEKLQANLKDNESFGFSIDSADDVVVIGSPDYELAGSKIGIVRTFRKRSNTSSFDIIANEIDLVDVDLIQSISIIDRINDIKINDVDFIDHAKLKLLGIVEQELTFKTPYDPAIYTDGIETTVVDSDVAWFEKYKGKIWWNISTAKWLNYEQGDINYRLSSWNQLAAGSTIDIYEWVETKLLPSEWSALADTVDGLSNNISGQPLYPDDNVYSKKELYNIETNQPTETLYYYWVKSSTIVPNDTIGRKISSAEIERLIINPAESGLPLFSIIDFDKIIAYNLKSNLSNDLASVNFQLYNGTFTGTPIHKEYILLTEGVADSVPNKTLETKWVDSLIGFDEAGKSVPDTTLPERFRYGIFNRPRQGMFKNRFEALKISFEYVNKILDEAPFADLISFNLLNDSDPVVEEDLRLYDEKVNSVVDLSQLSEVLGNFFPTRIKIAVFQVNLIDGEVDNIDIIDPGFGYKNVPIIEIAGDGTGATAEIEIDSQGRVISINVITRGRRYSFARVSIRPFSVLVENDSTLNGLWSLYFWDQARRSFYRGRTQAYDVRKYWSYKDWWEVGYDSSSRLVKEINFISEEASIISSPGDLIRIKEFANGGWAVILRVEDGQGEILSNYRLVGRENGTINFSDSLWNNITNPLGFDNVGLYDTAFYDANPSIELRKIFEIIKTQIFVDEYRVKWNELFFITVRYVLYEQSDVDWAFKTSFVNATHNVGVLSQKVSYKNDNLESFFEYIKEVIPYRTSVREFVSNYDILDNTNTQAIDFDLPAVFSPQERRIIPINLSNSLINSAPWVYWRDNQGLSLIGIELSDQGEGYTAPPRVVIEGGNNDAVAQAYISNGKVSKIRIVNPGSNFIKTPLVHLIGGNGSGNRSAKAVPILGEGKVRSFNLKIKFDRISKSGIFSSFSYEQIFTATGRDLVFDLSYPPTLDKSNISIFRNDQVVLNNEYSISLFINSNKQLSGRLIFTSVPTAGQIIKIVYEKNDEILDAVNRIDKLYSPLAGMKGKDFSQLMTGIDYGGVQIQGTTFDVTGGWDALPWFTDNWDSVEPSLDFYLVVDGSTAEITLPYVLESGVKISVYLQRVGESRSTRIDDVNFGTPQQTNSNALMPTIIGDGSTTTWQIHDYFRTGAGDVLVFRTFDSDGSVILDDVNLLDTQLLGGTFDNTTASGLNAEDIKIDGGEFVSPEKVPAPEENVPGQVMDSLSIKVFNTTASGASPIQINTLAADGTSTRYPIGISIFEPNSVLVYIDNVQYEYLGDSVIDYTIDFTTNEIVFGIPPVVDSIIEIIAIGKGGISLLDFQEFEGDGDTRYFACRADFDKTQSIFVTVDGEFVDTGFENSTEINLEFGTTFVPNKTVINFAVPPSIESSIKVICIGSAFDTDSSQLPLIRVNKQTFLFDGSTRNFELDGFVTLSRGSAISSMIVEINNVKLKGPDTYYRIYDGTNNEIPVGVDPELVVTSVDIRVYINNILQPFVTAYVYDGTNGIVIVNRTALELNDVIKIEIDTTSQYRVVNNDVVQIDALLPIEFASVISITWFAEYPTLDLVSDVYSGGKINYQLKRLPLDASYIWVYKNGLRLIKDKDYLVSVPRNIVYLKDLTTVDDNIEILEFGNEIFKDPRAWEIYKDMYNVSYYKRYGINEIKLARDLTYYDQTIEVTDASGLDDPIESRNVPGIIEIDKEKIQYFSKNGNTLGRLRRGCFGSAISEFSLKDTRVINLGISEIIPYSDQQQKYNFISDGSSLTIGPLDFIPTKSDRTDWERGTIPTDYGPCDIIEIFVGGKRLRKDHLYMFDETRGAVSPQADKLHEPEFSVDGNTAFVRLTTAVEAGKQITIIRKIGQVWYDKGQGTASSGVTFLSNNAAIAKFIDKKPTELP